MDPKPAQKRKVERPFVENVVDLVHLDQYTLGDRALQAELLQLFRTQLKNQTKTLVSCNTEDDWKSGVHTLKGAARSIGARQVCEVAEAMEAIPFADKEARDAILQQLSDVRAMFESNVGQYLQHR